MMTAKVSRYRWTKESIIIQIDIMVSYLEGHSVWK